MSCRGPTNIWWPVNANARGNPVVQTNNHEREDPQMAEESRRRQEVERQARRSIRLAEGGRGGGYNDRQTTFERQEWKDESTIDDFGRRIVRTVDAAMSATPNGNAVGHVVDHSSAPPGRSRGGSPVSSRGKLSKAERMQAALDRLQRRSASGVSSAACGGIGVTERGNVGSPSIGASTDSGAAEFAGVSSRSQAERSRSPIGDRIASSENLNGCCTEGV
eukprot:TRINITY_DN30050_c0_g1_i1.p1 TRINITY_DN30050_c0_g1~~TRINITY_DN30050_c0_g1_i1.p1  ORF type:complete len:220 (-),score=34.90 TRINITY_DN30050_c0_g1_i1:65-724(-)